MGDSIQSKVVSFSKSKVGQKVGTGECFDLADQALKHAGAKSAEDYGKVTANADYVWGSKVAVEKALAGDVIQFRNYKSDVTKEKAVSLVFSGGEEITYYQNLPGAAIIGYDHHTSVASTAIVRGSLTVLEQNVDRTGNGTKEKIVRARELYLKSQPKKVVKSSERITITVSWGAGVKKTMTNAAHKKFIDDLVKKYKSKVLTAKVATTTEIGVSGTISVYRAQAK